VSLDSDFRRRFGRPPTVVAAAPGRVNLIGEHTDYNGGFVLPTVIPQRTHVALAPRTDDVIRVVTDATALAGSEAEYRLGAENRTSEWIDYVQGCTAVLRADGHGIDGCDLAITSTVPAGAGVASSAALAVAVLRGFRRLFGLALDDVALARLAHRAECDFVGARVGLMDHMAASLGDAASALFLDARSLAWERVPLPPSFAMAVIDSGITHRHAGGGYNTRRAECERAATLLGVASLRALGVDDLVRVAALPAPLDRRVRHVVTENARVRQAVAALRADDTALLGRVLTAGHASLRDDFEVSIPAVDALVALADADDDVLGVRLTGGGFGGAVVVLTRPGRAAAVGARIAAAYGRRAAGGRVLVPAVARG